MISWIYYPRSAKPSDLAIHVVDAFKKVDDKIHSSKNELSSNDVLSYVTPHLAELGFRVETNKTRAGKVSVPVLFGMNGSIEKSFDADAYHQEAGFIVEVEAGRGVTNNQFLKDLFQACMMHDVQELAIAVRQIYRDSQDFERVVKFFDTLFASNRLQLPLKGILIIGY